MKLTNRAKKKWFKENVNSYEIYYYDCIDNPRIVNYTYSGYFHKECTSSFYDDDINSFARYIENMEDWEIFFKFRKFLRADINKKNIFKMSYSKYDMKNFME